MVFREKLFISREQSTINYIVDCASLCKTVTFRQSVAIDVLRNCNFNRSI
jgi:hypothetical protein